MSERRTLVRWWVWLIAGIVLVSLAAVLIIWWQPIYLFVTDREQVLAWVQRLGVWGPVAIVLLQLAQTVLAPIPGQVIGAVSGYLYGPWLGTLYSMIGVAVGSFINFWLARRLGRPLVVRLIGGQSIARLDVLVDRGGALFFFLLWLIPFTPDDLVSLAAGLTLMSGHQFLILMLLGRLPGVLVAVWVGANVARIAPTWWAVLFVGIAIAAIVLWRWGQRIQESVLRLVEWVTNRLGS
jgi:uncharacterized membrane protein YdjX (TVP38/TMEM64 family)